MRVIDAARARRWFWGLTLVAILAAGVLSHALTAAPSAATGLQVAGSALVFALSVTQAARILRAQTAATSRDVRPSRR